jgi:hypothetical protein
MPPLRSRPSISPAALKKILELKAMFESQGPERDLIPMIDAGGHIWLGLEDIVTTERNDSPPALGFSPRHEISPSMIEKVGGVDVVFTFSDEERQQLSTKVLDYRHGMFVSV